MKEGIMKKYAIMLLNPLFRPQEHSELFTTGNIENHILTVRNAREALNKTEELVFYGFGVMELSGSFDDELIEKINDISKGALCIGHVIYPKEQEQALKEYWKD